MGRPFRTEHGRRVRVDLSTDERELLAHLLDQVGELLSDGIDDQRPADPLAALLGLDPQDLPELRPGAADGADAAAEPADGAERDPALARLLPPAHRDDPDVAAEFRRLTEHGLRSRKRAALTTAGAALRREAPVALDLEEAQSLLKGLTDVRLVLGERLGLRTDDDADTIQDLLRSGGDADNPWLATAALYDVLTWWQESLVAALGPLHPPRR